MARVPALVFEVDGQRYGIEVTEVSKLLPYVRLRRLPQVPEYIVGVFRYREQMVPVVDLSQLISGKPSTPHLSTRIILVEHPGPPERLVFSVCSPRERATSWITTRPSWSHRVLRCRRRLTWGA